MSRILVYNLLEQSDRLADHNRRVLFDEARVTLEKAVGPVLEIGSLCGGSSLALMAAICATGNRCPLVTVDPFTPNFSLSKPDFEGLMPRFNGYYAQMEKTLAKASEDSGVYHVHYKVTDDDYMNHVWHTAHFLGKEPVTEPKFAFVHLDGGHEMGSEERQVKWFAPRLLPEGNLLVDDVMPDRPDKLKDFLLGLGGRMCAETEWVLR